MRKFLIAIVSLLLLGVLFLMTASTGYLPVNIPGISHHRPIEKVSPIYSERESEENLTLDFNGAVVVNNALGKIVLQGADVDNVEVRVVKKARSKLGAADLLTQIKIETETSPEATAITTLVPRTTSPEQASVDLFLTVPMELTADLRAGLGQVEVENVQGTLRIQSDLGAIKINHFTGDAAVEAALGAVEIQGSQFERELLVITHLGDVSISGSLAETTVIENKLGGINLHLPPEESYTVEAKVNLGNFSSNLPFRGEQSQNLVNGIIGSGEHKGNLMLVLDLGSLAIEHQ